LPEVEMELIHERCAGLDVHKETVVACVRVASGGQVQREVETFPTTTKGLLGLGDWLMERKVTHAVMESTGVYWKPVWHVLEGFVDLSLANANEVRNLPGRKSDISDSQWLADLLAHGMLRRSFVPERAIEELRELTRTRKQTVRDITRHAQRLEKLLQGANIKMLSVLSQVLGKSGRAILRAMIAGERDPKKLAGLAQGSARKKEAALAEALDGFITDHHRFLLRQHLDTVEHLEAMVEAIETRIDDVLRPFAWAAALLETIPGISETAARVLIAEFGVDMGRFPTAGHLVSWAGLCPRPGRERRQETLDQDPQGQPLAQDPPRSISLGRDPLTGLPTELVPSGAVPSRQDEGHCRCGPHNARGRLPHAP
jgi:transposase